MATQITLTESARTLASAGIPDPSNLIHLNPGATVEIVVQVESWGSPGNGWDDPGEGAEWCALSLSIGNQNYGCEIDLTPEIDAWIQDYFDLRIQQLANEQGRHEDDD